MWVSHSIIPSTGSACSHFPNQNEATVGKRLIHWLLSPLLFVIHILVKIIIVEGSLEVKLPTIWTDEKQSREEAERRERLEERRSEEKESEERRCRCAKR